MVKYFISILILQFICAANCETISKLENNRKISLDESNQNKGLLYKIEDESRKRTLILIGSDHFSNSKVTNIIEKIKFNLTHLCNKISSEVAPQIINEDISDLPKLKSVGNILSENLITEVQNKLKPKFFNMFSVVYGGQDKSYNFKDIPISVVTLSLLSNIDILGVPRSYGDPLDKIVFDAANARNIKPEYLESQRSWLVNMSAISDAEYLILIKELLLLTDNNEARLIMGKHYNSQMNGFANGDADLVNQEAFNILTVTTKIPEYLVQKLLFDRDIFMFQRIEDFIASNDTYCVAVGAAHLGGKKGLLQKLRDKNYKITQL